MPRSPRTKSAWVARERLRAAGAHWVVDTLDELPGVIDAIEALPETALP